MQTAPTVYIVEDDPAVRRSLEWLIGSAGLRAQSYPDAESYLAAYDPSQPGCVVADMGLPGANALEIQRKLSEDGSGIPLIIITGQDDVSTVVQAMRHGAFDYLEKPLSDKRLIEQIQAAVAWDQKNRQARAERELVLKRFKSLTPREREVMQRVVDGMFSRQIAEALNLSIKTVEAHRGRMMQKMQADGIAALVRMVQQLGDLGELDNSTVDGL